MVDGHSQLQIRRHRPTWPQTHAQLRAPDSTLDDRAWRERRRGLRRGGGRLTRRRRDDDGDRAQRRGG
ncbi:hypothetical protein E2562_036497 [Oryza meyeriana var. granulata]|uniref:Uncharacterized protein n=1 Tax=Oryza meyeriana var. granulata TaxID=110450 RepID=A0A6G1CC53_9ORYZ|nr:hypothetical protein E2562_036497 [Oryza meyeriana var. granulata]